MLLTVLHKLPAGKGQKILCMCMYAECKKLKQVEDFPVDHSHCNVFNNICQFKRASREWF